MPCQLPPNVIHVQIMMIKWYAPLIHHPVGQPTPTKWMQAQSTPHQAHNTTKLLPSGHAWLTTNKHEKSLTPSKLWQAYKTITRTNPTQNGASLTQGPQDILSKLIHHWKTNARHTLPSASPYQMANNNYPHMMESWTYHTYYQQHAKHILF